MKVTVRVERVVGQEGRRAAEDVRRALLASAEHLAEHDTPSAEQVRAWATAAVRREVRP